jgi:hypothetical protein
MLATARSHSVSNTLMMSPAILPGHPGHGYSPIVAVEWHCELESKRMRFSFTRCWICRELSRRLIHRRSVASTRKLRRHKLWGCWSSAGVRMIRRDEVEMEGDGKSWEDDASWGLGDIYGGWHRWKMEGRSGGWLHLWACSKKVRFGGNTKPRLFTSGEGRRR